MRRDLWPDREIESGRAGSYRIYVRVIASALSMVQGGRRERTGTTKIGLALYDGVRAMAEVTAYKRK
jgi:hypothetical protein